jgi:hypothetical protein
MKSISLKKRWRILQHLYISRRISAICKWPDMQCNLELGSCCGVILPDCLANTSEPRVYTSSEIPPNGFMTICNGCRVIRHCGHGSCDKINLKAVRGKMVEPALLRPQISHAIISLSRSISSIDSPLESSGQRLGSTLEQRGSTACWIRL